MRVVRAVAPVRNEASPEVRRVVALDEVAHVDLVLPRAGGEAVPGGGLRVLCGGVTVVMIRFLKSSWSGPSTHPWASR
jgi:hypothetical protein